MIHARNLTKIFGATTAVKDVSFDVAAGEVFVLLGPNGSGKTTTVRMLAALIAPTSGDATVLGYSLSGNEAARTAIRARVGLLTEAPGLYDRLTAYYNLLYFARLYRVPNPDAQIEKYLKLLELWDRRDEPTGGFSKGMKQKVAIARALIHEPELLFLDEPTSGLDPSAAKTLRDFLAHLKSEGRTIFLTTHNLAEAEELCDLIGIFKGHLIRVDTQQSLRDALFGRGAVVHFAGSAEPWLAVARALPFVRSVAVDVADASDTLRSALTVTLDNPDEQNPALIRALINADAPVRYVEPLRRSLEEAYLALLNGHAPGEPTGHVREIMRIASGHMG